LIFSHDLKDPIVYSELEKVEAIFIVATDYQGNVIREKLFNWWILAFEDDQVIM